MNENWDVIIIGGGPAGMMAAQHIAKRGLSVVLLEKNATLGKKLLITGGGRCNVTNAEFDNRKLLSRFGDDGKYLFSAFSQWDVKKTLDFFHSRNMETKIENENRVFPKSNKAQSVFDVLYGAMQEYKVRIMTDSPVKEILVEGGKITGVRTSSGIILGKKVIIATGGTSHPETGSTGDAYKWLEKLGHKIIIPEPSLVPLTTKDAWTHKLAGMSLSNIKITTYVDQVKQNVKATKNSKPENSKVLFTHVGLSGPTILNMSKEIRELLKYGDVSITIDLLPKYDYSKLNTELQNIFETNNNKKIKNSLDSILPSRLTATILEMSNINPEKKCNEISREERVSLMKIIKAVPINIKGLQSLDKAIISSGGVDLEEVDFRTMQSKIHPNLFLIGDILNIDRPSGGFSLQICWTTGMVAAINI
jgi:predicted Rossmann fold flavoprotein